MPAIDNLIDQAQRTWAAKDREKQRQDMARAECIQRNATKADLNTARFKIVVMQLILAAATITNIAVAYKAWGGL